jgi:hypothetical protein
MVSFGCRRRAGQNGAKRAARTVEGRASCAHSGQATAGGEQAEEGGTAHCAGGYVVTLIRGRSRASFRRAAPALTGKLATPTPTDVRGVQPAQSDWTLAHLPVLISASRCPPQRQRDAPSSSFVSCAPSRLASPSRFRTKSPAYFPKPPRSVYASRSLRTTPHFAAPDISI